MPPPRRPATDPRAILDDQLLTDYISTFYGYGDYAGRYWFLGMEEGGGKTLAENAGRIAIWDRRGQRKLDDLADYHFAIAMPGYFVDHPHTQDTWGRLIRCFEPEEPLAEALQYAAHWQWYDSGHGRCSRRRA